MQRSGRVSGVRRAEPADDRQVLSTPFRIGICGSYGGLNVGDEAILESIVGELRRRVNASFVVFSRNREDTLWRHKVEEAVDVHRLSRAELTEKLHTLDLFVLGGGGILFDGEAGIFVKPLLAAHALELATMTWAVGAGPLRDRDERRLVKSALAPAHLVTVRDEQSRLLLEELELPQEIRVVADPALLLEADPFGAELLQREGIEPGMRVIGLSVRECGPAAPDLNLPAYQELLANVVDYVVERMEATVLFVPMEEQDRQLSHGVASRVRNVRRVLLLKGDYSPRQMCALMARMELAIGMRLHFLIFAASRHVPFVALPYGPKVTEFAGSLGMPVAPATNAGQLLAAIDRAWDLRDALRQRLVERTAERAVEAAQPADWAVQILESQKSTARHPVVRSRAAPWFRR
jgi:polysaccharide pyruvyl transferase CsaB